MKTWDPLSVFKYLRGCEVMRLTFFLLTVANIKDAYVSMPQNRIYNGYP